MRFVILSGSFALLTCGSSSAVTDSDAEQSRYARLKQQIFANAYATLPRYRVSAKLFKRNPPSQPTDLLDDANRTLRDNRDFLGPERGQKLLQANGICFAGEWQINQQSSFSGLFKQGERVPIIARASTTFSGTRQSERRALGLAIKLLPEDLGDAPSLNIFTLHSAGGVKQKHLLDLSMDNEPPLGRVPRLRDISTALKLQSTLLKADRQAGSENPSVTYRNVQALADYGERGNGEQNNGNAPRWIRFSSATEHRVDEDDFRDELRVENYPDRRLIYRIEVGDHEQHKKSRATWQTIGQLILHDSITSKACDTQLHFAHPKN